MGIQITTNFTRGINFFPPGNGVHFGDWIKNAQLKDITKKGKIRSYQELKHRRELLVLDEWRYLQLKHCDKLTTTN